MDFLKGLFTIGTAAVGGGWLRFALKAAPYLLVVVACGFIGSKVVSCTQAKNEAKLERQAVVINAVTTANTELAKDNTNIAASGEVTVKAVVDTNNQVNALTKKAATREATVIKKIAEVNQQIDSLPQKTAESEKARVDQTSTIQIDAMWSSYCDAAPSSTQCQVKT